jgi:carbon storage regulator CsrA
MLVLSRKPNESVTLDCNGVQITLAVVSIRKGAVRLGFAAPGSVQILRTELLDTAPPAADAAAPAETASLPATPVPPPA